MCTVQCSARVLAQIYHFVVSSLYVRCPHQVGELSEARFFQSSLYGKPVLQSLGPSLFSFPFFGNCLSTHNVKPVPLLLIVYRFFCPFTLHYIMTFCPLSLLHFSYSFPPPIRCQVFLSCVKRGKNLYTAKASWKEEKCVLLSICGERRERYRGDVQYCSTTWLL